MMAGPLGGALIGAGVWLVLNAFLPAAPPTARDRRGPDTRAGSPLDTTQFLPPLLSPPCSGWLASLGDRLVQATWWPHLAITTRARRDLPICGRSPQHHAGRQVTAAVLGLLTPPVLALTLPRLGLPAPPGPLWTIGALILAGIGYLAPNWTLAAEAARRRRDARYALSAYLDLTVIGLAGGAGLEQALDQAATGTHPITTAIRRAMDQAVGRGQPVWTALDHLGQHLAVTELRELAACLSLAGSEGAKVRASLTAKAAALRQRLLTDIETQAHAATERMSLPLAVMFTAFLLFVLYPAITQITNL